MMKCDDIALEALVDPQNVDADEINTHDPDVARHVESCTRCQNRLARLAGDAEQWDEIRHHLSTSFAIDPDAECLGAHQGWKRPVAWDDAMARTLLSPASHPEMLGRIGRYDVEHLIGSGGMGVVFKAYDTELNRPVAVKLLAPYLSASGAARNRFAREARAAAAVVDDHVVPIHNVETDDEHPFLVMKFIAGGSLQQRLNREGPLDVCEVLRIGMQTAKGLAAAHAQGLIHRDVKPSNILLDEGVDRALLTDFGLARATDDANLTRSGFHPGTPHYMSPEQVRGESIDERSDLFGHGCVLYGLCTGHPPFRSDTSYAVLRRITDDTPRPIRETNPDIPAWLEQIVMKLLAKSADDRYDSADQVAQLLEDCLAHVQQPTTTPLPESLRAVAESDDSDRRTPIGRIIAAATFGFFLILAGVTILLEMNKGTLTIKSDYNDVPIRIMQGDTIYKKLTVSKEANTVRIAAGKYVVEIDGEFTDMSVVGSEVSLRRGETVIARIVKSDERKMPSAEQPDWWSSEKQNEKVQIWGPTKSGGSAVALKPPSDEEVMQALEKVRPENSGIPMLTETQRKNVRIVKEKIADYIDPPRYYPTVGHAQVHHAHYKCTIRFDAATKVGYPVPHTLKSGEVFDVVYIDHTHFHMVGNAKNLKSEQYDVDFAKLSSFRDRLHEADRVCDQMQQSVERWQKRVELYKQHPSGRVNGKDIANSDSIEDARQSVAKSKGQQQRYLRDRDFLHREVMSQFVILRKQYDIALGDVALAKEEANAYQKRAVTKSEVKEKQQAVAKLELKSAGLAELIRQCTSLIKEFGIKHSPDSLDARTEPKTGSASESCTKVYPIGSYVSEAMFGLKQNSAATGSAQVDEAIKAAADDLIEVIEGTCGPCRSIHFMPASMELVVQHTTQGQDEIQKLLETMRANDLGRINLKLIAASDGLIAEEHEEQFEKWAQGSSKLTAEEVLKLETWMKAGLSNSVVPVALVPGKPASVQVMNFPVTVVARHVRDANKIQIRLDQNGSLPGGDLTGTIEPDGSGLILKTVDAEYFFWLVVPSVANPDSNVPKEKKNAGQDKSADLIGSWRVLEFQDAEMESLQENIVLTFGKYTSTWLNESDELSESIYRILPNNELLFVSQIESLNGETNIKTKYRYRLKDSSHLELLTLDDDGKLTGNTILLEHIPEGSDLSTYVSQVISVDTDETYGWDERAYVDTHRRLVKSEKLLGSVKWPQEIDLLPADKKEAVDWLRRNLEVKLTKDNEIKIGMHGHVQTMKQREQIVAMVADAYEKMVAEMESNTSKEVIELLRKAHADVVKQREAAELAHQKLLLKDPTDTKEVANSKANLARLNDLLTEVGQKLFELGVPALSGSPEMSIERASTNAQVTYNRLANSPNVSLSRSVRYIGPSNPDSTFADIMVELHCGDDFVLSFLDKKWPKKNRLNGLVLKLREIHGVNYQFRSTGKGDILSKVVVRDPSQRCDRDAKLKRRIELAFESAGLSEKTFWTTAKATRANEDTVSVSINCGADFLMPYSDVKWRSHEAKSDIKINQLYFQLNMIDGVDAQHHITGLANEVTIVVNDPTGRYERDPNLKAKIDAILKSTGVWEKTKWLNTNANDPS